MLENAVEKDHFSFVAFSILARLFISVWKAKVICTLVQLFPESLFPEHNVAASDVQAKQEDIWK